MSDTFTICTKCKHLISRGDIWYDNDCGAITNPQFRDPYDGKMTYGYANKHPHIRDINKDGNCEHFDKKRWSI